MIQGSPEWHAARVGRITASEIHSVVARLKDKTALCVVDPVTKEVIEKIGNGAAAEKRAEKLKDLGACVEEAVYSRGERSDAFWSYRDRIAVEMLTGKPASVEFENYAMRRGKELEPFARAEFEAFIGDVVEEVGIIYHPRHNFVAASPDGITLDAGCEIKCPINPVIHMNTIIDGMPAEHMMQVQANMWCRGAPFWYFISYHPDFPDGLKLYVEIIRADFALQAEMEQSCIELWNSANEKVELVMQKRRMS